MISSRFSTLAFALSFALACGATVSARGTETRVVDGRYYAPPIEGYLHEASWYCNYLASELIYVAPSGRPITISNAYFSASRTCALYAEDFDAYAAAVDYAKPSERAAATHDYLYWRYWQLYYSYQTAGYLYLGMVEMSADFPGYDVYPWIQVPYERSMLAYYYGLADFEQG